MNGENAITLVEASQESAALVSVGEIEAQIRRAEKMAEALDKIRSLAVARTVPGDWVAMGGNVYLEGDGALRIAPMIGLRMSNVRKSVEIGEGNVVRVTISCDAESALFGTRFSGLSRTRTTADAFLTQNGKKEKADMEDVEASAYKGLVARAVQMLAGLSGLTRDDLQTRFGIKAGGEVAYKTGASEAKKSDAAAAAPGLVEVQKLLLELFEGDANAAADWLEKATENKEKGWPGKRDANKLTEKGVAFVLKKLQAMDAASREPGEGG